MIKKLKSIWIARFGMAAALISLAGGDWNNPVNVWFLMHALSMLMCGTSLFLSWNDKRKLLEDK